MTGILKSRKLQYLVRRPQRQGPQMQMTDLRRIQFLTRCRLSCHFDFQGDFGSRQLCPCGNEDTMAHVRRGCALYRDILPKDTEDYFGVEKAEAMYEAILKRRVELKSGPALQPPPPSARPGPPMSAPSTTFGPSACLEPTQPLPTAADVSNVRI